MPTPKNDLHHDFRMLQEELQRVNQRLEAVETRLNSNWRIDEVGDLDAKEVQVLDSIAEEQDSNVEHEAGHVPFPESAWSFPVILGLVDAGPLDVTFAILLLLLNLGMQVAFSLVILDDDFMGEAFETQLGFAQRWRTSLAHDASYLDLAETSLVSRVCSVDGALILSTTQATLVAQINSFLGLSMDQFEPSVFQPGSLLCMCCILLWALCVYKEYRSIWLGAEAILTIPRNRGRTDFRHNTFHTISKGRLKMLLCTYMMRAIIATFLLVSGVRWLAQTTSITDLMLNAVALNAILDVDEFLFAALTPMSIQLAVQNLQPIKMQYSRRRSQVESGVMFFLLLGVLLLPYLLLVQPLVGTMADVKWALCGGNQTFVVQRNTDTQVVVGLRTNPASRGPSGVSAPLSVVETAVQRHSFSDPMEEPDLVYFRSNYQIFNTFADRDMTAESSAWTFCLESSVLQPGGIYYKDPLVDPLVQVLLRTAAASLGRVVAPGGAVSCGELADLCDDPEARLLRMVCGLTCGCANPLASPWHKVSAHGCQDLCTEIAVQAPAACVDVVTSPGAEMEERWNFFWDSYPDMMSAFYGSNVSTSSVFPVILNIISSMKAEGCRGFLQSHLQRELATQSSWCEGRDNLWRPLAWLCPESCGCLNGSDDVLPSHCPRTCGASG